MNNYISSRPVSCFDIISVTPSADTFVILLLSYSFLQLGPLKVGKVAFYLNIFLLYVYEHSSATGPVTRFLESSGMKA